VFRIRVKDAIGKTVWLGTDQTLTSGVIPSAGAAPMRQGAMKAERVGLPSHPIVTLQDVELTVDSALFSDGSACGPDKAKKVERIRGSRAEGP
jgi:hypothetical protein